MAWSLQQQRPACHSQTFRRGNPWTASAQVQVQASPLRQHQHNATTAATAAVVDAEANAEVALLPHRSNAISSSVSTTAKLLVVGLQSRRSPPRHQLTLLLWRASRCAVPAIGGARP